MVAVARPDLASDIVALAVLCVCFMAAGLALGLSGRRVLRLREGGLELPFQFIPWGRVVGYGVTDLAVEIAVCDPVEPWGQDLHYVTFPIRPDDQLTFRATVLETRVSKSRPEMGFVRFMFELSNQAGERAVTLTNSLMISRRDGKAQPA